MPKILNRLICWALGGNISNTIALKSFSLFISRVIHAANDLLTPFHLRARIFGVAMKFSTMMEKVTFGHFS